MTRDLDVCSYLVQMCSRRHTSNKYIFSQWEFMIIYRKMLPTAVGVDILLNPDLKCILTYFVSKLLGTELTPRDSELCVIRCRLGSYGLRGQNFLLFNWDNMWIKPSYLISVRGTEFMKANTLTRTFNLFQVKPTRCTLCLSIFNSTSLNVLGNYDQTATRKEWKIPVSHRYS